MTIRKAQISRLIQRNTWMAKAISGLYRFTRPRYTAGVVGVLFDAQGRVLLVEHVFHAPHAWGLPGGWMNRAEDPAVTLVREFQEELALEVQVIQPVIVERSNYFGAHLDIGYLVACATPPEKINLSFELNAYAWYEMANIPRLVRFHYQTLMAAWEVQASLASAPASAPATTQSEVIS